ncbi:MAG: bifunctional riboflavin kinase/FAD synthetase [Pigmentiphaga sp.]
MNSSPSSLRVYRGAPPPLLRQPSALTIGNFDGVHLGHRAMLTRLVSAAEARGLVPTVMTFEPHPREYFACLRGEPQLAPPRISGLRDKILDLAKIGVRQVIVERFDKRLADMPATRFIDELLRQGLDTRWLLVGDDFRFGARRAGDVTLLRARGGFEVESMDSITDRQGRRVSSTDVRASLAAGDLARVEDLLGHRYHMSGHVVHGLKLGRSLGFRTINLRVPPRSTALQGIFVVQVHGLAETPLNGVASLGVRPTVTDANRLLLEVHLLDYNQNAYGKLVRVEFLKKLRDEAKFVDLPTLIEAIATDVEHARAHFAAAATNAVAARSATDRI